MLLVGRSALVVPVQFAAPLGLSDVDPVGSLVAGAGEALGLDEGFQQNGSVSVAVLPVLGELTRGQGQQLGGEVLGLDPGKDQETGVVDDQLKVPLPFRRTPADEAVARGGFPGGGAKAKQGQDAVLPTSEVAQLSPRQRGVSQIVIAVDVFIPQSGVRAAQDRLQMHAGQLMHRSGQRRPQ